MGKEMHLTLGKQSVCKSPTGCFFACNFLLFLHLCADEFHDDAIHCLVF